MVCPVCRAITPPGLFCAICGAKLDEPEPQADPDPLVDEPVEEESTSSPEEPAAEPGEIVETPPSVEATTEDTDVIDVPGTPR